MLCLKGFQGQPGFPGTPVRFIALPLTLTLYYFLYNSEIVHVYSGPTWPCWQNWKGRTPRTQGWKGEYIVCIQLCIIPRYKLILFCLSKGNDGAQGSQGPAGPRGSSGSPGLMVATILITQHLLHLSHFIPWWDLSCWCLQLKGPPGIEGVHGKDGKPGLRVCWYPDFIDIRGWWWWGGGGGIGASFLFAAVLDRLSSFYLYLLSDCLFSCQGELGPPGPAGPRGMPVSSTFRVFHCLIRPSCCVLHTKKSLGRFKFNK